MRAGCLDEGADDVIASAVPAVAESGPTLKYATLIAAIDVGIYGNVRLLRMDYTASASRS